MATNERSRESTDHALLDRVDAVLNRALEETRIVGGVVRVARDGVLVAHRAVGLADREERVPMQENALFRIASLTKPIVAVTTLGLVERGVLRLDDPITRWLPEFRPTLGGIAPEITIRHLLTHTSGLSYAFLEPKGGPYHRANVSDGLDQPGLSIDENLRRLGSVALAFAPGSAFLYSLSFDVLGAIVARATGKTLPDVVKSAVTGPLEMNDTSFHVRNAARLVTPYADGAPTPTKIVDGSYVPFFDGGVTFAPSRATNPDSYPSGGAGMVGTAHDFLTFLEAIRTRHPFAPTRALDEMTRDQIAPITSPILGDGWGFGFGAAVLRDPAAASSPLHRGSVRWGGAYGHSWWIDPEARTSTILMTNAAFEGMTGPLRDEIARAVVGA